MAARSFLLPPSWNLSVDKEKYELSTRVITAETSAVENEVQLQEAVSPWLLLCLRAANTSHFLLWLWQRKKLAEMQEVVKTQEQDMKDLTTELVSALTF